MILDTWFVLDIGWIRVVGAFAVAVAASAVAVVHVFAVVFVGVFLQLPSLDRVLFV